MTFPHNIHNSDSIYNCWFNKNAEMFLQKSCFNKSIMGKLGTTGFLGIMIQSILGVDDFFETNHLPIGTIYGIFTHIWLKFMVTIPIRSRSQNCQVFIFLPAEFPETFPTFF